MISIRLFATKAANIKKEKTDRQTDKLCTEITEEKTARKNSYKRDIAILACVIDLVGSDDVSIASIKCDA